VLMSAGVDLVRVTEQTLQWRSSLWWDNRVSQFNISKWNWYCHPVLWHWEEVDKVEWKKKITKKCDNQETKRPNHDIRWIVWLEWKKPVAKIFNWWRCLQ
jgi:hypothetical protein